MPIVWKLKYVLRNRKFRVASNASQSVQQPFGLSLGTLNLGTMVGNTAKVLNQPRRESGFSAALFSLQGFFV